MKSMGKCAVSCVRNKAENISSVFALRYFGAATVKAGQNRQLMRRSRLENQIGAPRVKNSANSLRIFALAPASYTANP